jgi:hypothetical protein
MQRAAIISAATGGALPFQQDPSVHLAGWCFIAIGALLLLYLLYGLRTGKIRHWFMTWGEFKEDRLGIEQTAAERERSERQGSHPLMPLVAIAAAIGVILVGLVFLNVIPLH